MVTPEGEHGEGGRVFGYHLKNKKLFLPTTQSIVRPLGFPPWISKPLDVGSRLLFCRHTSRLTMKGISAAT